MQGTLQGTKLLTLLDIIIDHKVPGGSFQCGLPIGNLTSQRFAKFYLGELDHFIKDRKHIEGHFRYMDDFISFANDKESLRQLLSEIRLFVRDQLRLELEESVTTIAPVTEGFPLLGFRMFPGLIRIKRETLVRMSKKIKI